MLKNLSNDSKLQMRLNIKRHRQKLLQYLENTNDTVLKPKIKLISNDIEKSNLNHNVKTKTRSSITEKQLQPCVKVNIQEESLPNVELKLEPLSNIKIKDPKSPPVVSKKLKEQLIEELLNSSSSEEIDGNISDENNGDWNEIYQTHNKKVSSNSSIIKSVKYDGHKQLANDKSKEEYMYYSCDSVNSVLNIKKRHRTKKTVNLRKHQSQTDQTKYTYKKHSDRSKQNASERARRACTANRFKTLRKCCSFLLNNKRVPSKHSILLAAKKEIDLLQHFDEKMIAEKKKLYEANISLKTRIDQLHRRQADSDHSYSLYGCKSNHNSYT